MAVPKPNPRLIAPKPRQTSAVPANPGSRSGAKAAPSQSVARGILQSARDVFAHKSAPKVLPRANASYATGRVRSPLAPITQDRPGTTPSLISHTTAVDFLNHFLAKGGKAKVS